MATTASPRGRVLRLLRTVHTWLGVFVFPWVIAIGATGFYLNHEDLVRPVIERPDYDEAAFAEWPAAEVTEEAARARALAVWPGEEIERAEAVSYHGHPAWQVKMPSGLVIVTRDTGHSYVKTAFLRRTYAPDGSLLHTKVYWGALFKRLHVRGWVDSSLGTWLADITGLAMVVFGLSGIVLWATPRLRRLGRAVARRG